MPALAARLAGSLLTATSATSHARSHLLYSFVRFNFCVWRSSSASTAFSFYAMTCAYDDGHPLGY